MWLFQIYAVELRSPMLFFGNVSFPFCQPPDHHPDHHTTESYWIIHTPYHSTYSKYSKYHTAAKQKSKYYVLPNNQSMTSELFLCIQSSDADATERQKLHSLHAHNQYCLNSFVNFWNFHLYSCQFWVCQTNRPTCTRVGKSTSGIQEFIDKIYSSIQSSASAERNMILVFTYDSSKIGGRKQARRDLSRT